MANPERMTLAQVSAYAKVLGAEVGELIWPVMVRA
jgi:hypothetical protein